MTPKFEVNDVVAIRAKRKLVDCVIVERRKIKRGRHAGKLEYKCAPVQEADWISVKCSDAMMAKRDNHTYSEDDLANAIHRMESAERDSNEVKRERAERGRKAIGDIAKRNSTGQISATKIGVGDKVLIRGRNCPNWTAIVGSVNTRTGKVGLLKNEYSHITSKLRWVHPDVIIEVMAANRELPTTITDGEFDKLAEDGHVQLKRGREFIERSYQVAFDRVEVLKGADYDGASLQVNFDPGLKVYWRSTGCFD